MNFKFGATHYGDEISNIFNSNNRASKAMDEVMNKMEANYWGVVEKEQWRANNQSVRTGKGEIVAMFVAEAIGNVHVISLEDRVMTILATDNDIANGAVESAKRRLQEARSYRGRLNGMIRPQTREVSF